MQNNFIKCDFDTCFKFAFEYNVRIMKKGEHVQISNAASKPARRMAWTEVQTGYRVTENEEVFYHRSGSPIRVFAGSETICTFADKDAGGDGYTYEITVPAGTEIFIYSNESRFELTIACKVRYIGRRYYRYGNSWKPGQSPTLVDATL